MSSVARKVNKLTPAGAEQVRRLRCVSPARRALSALFAAALVVSMFPAQAFALLGSITIPDSSTVKNGYAQGYIKDSSSGREVSRAGTFYYLQNDYLTFIVRPDGSSSTVPTMVWDYYLDGSGNKVSRLTDNVISHIPITEQYTFRVQSNPYMYDSPDISLDDAYNTELDATLESVSLDGSDSNLIHATYKLYHPDSDALVATAKIEYSIVQAGKGATEGEMSSADDGRTWGVSSTCTVTYEWGTYPGTTDPYIQIALVTDHLDLGVSYTPDDSDDSDEESASSRLEGALAISWSADGGTTMTSTAINVDKNISQSYVAVNENTATEAYTGSFTHSNAFVALSFVDSDYSYPSYYSYEAQYLKWYGCQQSRLARVFTTYNDVEFTPYTTSKNTKSMKELWGYRDLYTSAERESGGANKATESSYQEAEGSQYLGIVKSGTGFTVVEATSADELKSALGTSLSGILRGTYSRSTQSGVSTYTFTGGCAALSSTVSATWDEWAGGSFQVCVNTAAPSRSYVSAKGVNLSIPSFTFWTPKDKSSSSSWTLSASSGALTIGGLSTNNDACMNIEIPGADTTASTATLGVDGSVEFSGVLSVSTPVLEFANLSLDRLAFDSKGNISGFEAKGEASMSDLLGLTVYGGSAEAEINTFKGEERYYFSLNISVPQLFETGAELELTRLKSGQLVPNTLSFAAAAEQGIPLVSPVVVAELNGIGGGFSNLASTIDGGFTTVPPIKLSMEAQATILKLLSGKAKMTVGVGSYEMTLDNANILGLALGAKYTESAYFTGESRTSPLNGAVYTGLAVGGGKTLTISLPNTSTRIIGVDGGVSIDVFAGVNNYSNSSIALLLEFNGNGYVKAGLYFPEKIGSLKLPKCIRGKTISEAELALALGVNTHLYAGDENLLDAIKNASTNATLSYSTKIAGNTVRVQAIFNKKTINIAAGTWFGSVDSSFSWGNASSKSLSIAETGETDDAYYAVLEGTSGMETLASSKDSEIGLQSIENDPDDLSGTGITVTANGSNEKSYTVDLSNMTADASQIEIQLTPKEAVSGDDALKSAFTVTKGTANEAVELSWLDDLISSTGNTIEESTLSGILESGNYNAYLGEDCVVFSPGEKTTFTISSDAAFDIEVFGFEKGEELSDTDGTPENLKADKSYVLGAYLVADDGTYYEYDEAELDSSASQVPAGTTISVEASIKSDNFPSGDYDLAYRLLEKTLLVDESGDPVLDDNGGKQYYYTVLDEYAPNTTVTNTNTRELAAVTDVQLTAIGSEQLKATWAEPTGYTADGYIVSIYTKDDTTGEWVDSGESYEISEDEAKYSDNPYRRTLTLAPTVAGEDTEGKSMAISAGQDVRIKVEAYKNIEVDADGDGTIDDDETYAQRSLEAYSSDEGTYLPEATYLNLSYSPTPTALDDGSNMKVLYVEPGDKITTTADGGIYSISVTRTDDVDDADKYLSTSYSRNATTAETTVPDFTGSITIEVKVTDSDGDVTTDYLVLRRDDVAPIVTLDVEDGQIQADENGNFTVSGTTEPGLTLTFATNTSENGSATVVANEDGSFTISGTLSEDDISETNGTRFGELYVEAQDTAGNTGNTGALVLLAEPAPYTITLDANGGTVDPAAAETDDSGAVSGLPTPTRTGFEFEGWYTAAEGGEAVTDGYVFSADATIYAHWTENGGGSGGDNGSNNGTNDDGSGGGNSSGTSGGDDSSDTSSSAKSTTTTGKTALATTGDTANVSLVACFVLVGFASLGLGLCVRRRTRAKPKGRF